MALKSKYDEYEESEALKNARRKLEAKSNYQESDAVKNAKTQMENHNANQVPKWNGGTYGKSLQDALSKITNRQKFSYDLNGDALYNQYKNQYITQGKLAMMDSIGQASAMTGGYGNSYAATVGNQAYQGYLQKLNDVVPELYQMAYDRYVQEGNDLKDQYSILNNQYQTEYGEYRDKVGDWNAEASRLSDAYYNAANAEYNRFADTRDYLTSVYNNERSFDYGAYSDAYNRAMNEYELEENIRHNKVLEEASAISAKAKTGGATKQMTTAEIIDKLITYKDAGDNTSVAAFLDALVEDGIITSDFADSLYAKYSVGSELGPKNPRTLATPFFSPEDTVSGKYKITPVGSNTDEASISDEEKKKKKNGSGGSLPYHYTQLN